MNINMHLDKDDTIDVVTVFPKVLGQYLNEDIYSYKHNTDDLVEKVLLLENIDFLLSLNKKLVNKMRAHPEAQ